MNLRICLLASALVATGCVSTSDDAGDDDGSATTAHDVAQYDALQAQLEQHRSMFLTPGAAALAGIGTRVFWLQFATDSPTLHSYDTPTSTTVDYTFGIGDADDYNYRASESLIVNAENTGDNVVLHAFALAQPAASAGDLLLPPPADGVKWWAYAPDHGDVYYVITGDATEVWKWTPATNANTMLFTLESLGVQVGELWDFGVDSGTMVFIESGRAWSLNLTTRQPIALGNTTEATAASQNTDGVLLLTDDGPQWYSYAAKSLRDVTAAIAAASYHLDSTFAQIQDYSSGLAQFGHTVGYLGDGGLFTFDLDTDAVAPLLLDARDDSVVYASPVFLTDGSVFVQGLQSNEGDIGADGPIYRLDTKL